MAISISLAVVSLCRTAQLAMLLETISAVIIYIRHRDSYRDKRSIKVLILTFIAAAALGFAAGKVLTIVDEIDLNAYATTDFEETYYWVYGDETRIKINSFE